jgi:hypothetical protein
VTANDDKVQPGLTHKPVLVHKKPGAGENHDNNNAGQLHLG